METLLQFVNIVFVPLAFMVFGRLSDIAKDMRSLDVRLARMESTIPKRRTDNA
ncbi:MAG: hypothetical protein ACREUQ_07370 [Burkholderiales bacterium]